MNDPGKPNLKDGVPLSSIPEGGCRRFPTVALALAVLLLVPVSAFAWARTGDSADSSSLDSPVDTETIRLPVVEGKDIRFGRISTSQGLSQVRVSDMVQDDQGFIWFGTWNGLNRYDGYNFKVFKHDPERPESLGGVYIYSLFKDRAGTIWVGTDQSLDRFDPLTEKFSHYHFDVPDSSGLPTTVNQISQDSSGMLWLSTRKGLFRLDPVTGKSNHFYHDPRIVEPDGTVKHIHGIGHPVLSATGELVQVVGTMVDVTERKRAEEARDRLRRLEADLAHINRVSTLGEMAASLAHEIKQPIAAAITSANSCIEWLAHEPPNLDRARAAAARIDKYGNRAAEIIDGIRSFYKKSPPQRELVDVNGIIRELLTLLESEATRSSVAMRTELAAELPKIMADRVQLQQVFMNLMLNGIEAMGDSGGELTVKSELQDGQLQFSVSDTGVGLPLEKMDQIFSAFYTNKPQGSGMGLTISRSIVDSHGGRLWATTSGRRGATFHFTLPTHVMESALVV
jgi:signal transduction histidine kinase